LDYFIITIGITA